MAEKTPHNVLCHAHEMKLKKKFYILGKDLPSCREFEKRTDWPTHTKYEARIFSQPANTSTAQTSLLWQIHEKTFSLWAKVKAKGLNQTILGKKVNEQIIQVWNYSFKFTSILPDPSNCHICSGNNPQCVARCCTLSNAILFLLTVPLTL